MDGSTPDPTAVETKTSATAMDAAPETVRPAQPVSRARRLVLLGVGHLCVGLGVIGAFLPVMPTTIFLILAAWAYGHASPGMRQWLLEHPKFGPSLQAWHKEGAIPRKAKVLAVTMMAASVAITAALTEGWTLVAIQSGILICVVLYVVTRPEPKPH
ncbi:MAG: YbaN family protein [Rhodospirillaceae bacterium]